MEYIIEDEFVIELEPVIKPKPEAEVEVVLPVITLSNEETPDVTPLQVLDYGSTSIECAFNVATDQAEEVVNGVLCGTINPPTFDNADYRLLHGQGSIDLAFAGLSNNTEYYLRPYALSNLGYKYGGVVAQRTKASPIPDEYQLVEYLQSNGLQYIDTNYLPTSITKWEFDYEFIDSIQSQNGMSNTSSSDRFVIANINGLYVALGGGVNTGIQVSGVRHSFVLDARTSSYSVDGIAHTITNTFIRGVYPLYLFARNTGGSIVNWSSGKLYKTSLSELDEIKRNLYPVYRKSDNKPGMYDIVNNQFYVNQGTSEFIVGPDKEWEE